MYWAGNVVSHLQTIIRRRILATCLWTKRLGRGIILGQILRSFLLTLGMPVMAKEVDSMMVVASIRCGLRFIP